MQAAFLHAAFTPPFKVLGKWLKPYSVGHQILLERFQTGYEVGAANQPEFKDFIFSVWICSRTYRTAVSDLQEWSTLAKVKLWSWRCGNFDVGAATRCFREYMEVHTSEPTYFIDDSKAGSPISMPWGIFLKQHIQEKIKISEDEALNFRYKEAFLIYLRSLAERDCVTFATETDMKLRAAAKAFEEKQKVSSN